MQVFFEKSVVITSKFPIKISEKIFSANRKLYHILYYNMNTPVIAGYLKAITEEFTHQITDMAHKVLPASKELPQELDEYISRCLAHIMVYSIIKIISKEPDDRIVTQRLITTVRVCKNGILSLLKFYSAKSLSKVMTALAPSP